MGLAIERWVIALWAGPVVTTVVPYRVFRLQDIVGWTFYSRRMRQWAAGIVCLAAAIAVAADTPSPSVPTQSLCSDSAGAPRCQAPARDLKAARQAFERGLKLQKSKNLEQAFHEFQEAASLVPQNIDYLTAREVGARIISVCTGIYKREDLEPLGPDACVQSCAELLTDAPADTPPLRP